MRQRTCQQSILLLNIIWDASLPVHELSVIAYSANAKVRQTYFAVPRLPNNSLAPDNPHKGDMLGVGTYREEAVTVDKAQRIPAATPVRTFAWDGSK